MTHHICSHEPVDVTYHFRDGEYHALIPFTASEARALAAHLPDVDTGADGLLAVAEHLDDLSEREGL